MKKNTITNKYEAYYGLPSDVVFCNDCVISIKDLALQLNFYLR